MPSRFHDLTNAIKTHNNYITISSDNIEAMLRVSSYSRRSMVNNWPGNQPNDIDIAQIKVKSTHKRGCATLFILRLIKASSLLRVPRGVYLEQTITLASQALAESLIRKGKFFQLFPAHS